MAAKTNPVLHGWRYGIHPRATGMRVRGLTRVNMPLGEALRLELVSEAPGESNESHLQYYVVTEAGPWALWLSCPSDEMAEREAFVRQLEFRIE